MTYRPYRVVNGTASRPPGPCINIPPLTDFATAGTLIRQVIDCCVNATTPAYSIKINPSSVSETKITDQTSSQSQSRKKA